jgi:hypothetical protein
MSLIFAQTRKTGEVTWNQSINLDINLDMTKLQSVCDSYGNLVFIESLGSTSKIFWKSKNLNTISSVITQGLSIPKFILFNRDEDILYSLNHDGMGILKHSVTRNPSNEITAIIYVSQIKSYANATYFDRMFLDKNHKFWLQQSANATLHVVNEFTGEEIQTAFGSGGSSDWGAMNKKGEFFAYTSVNGFSKATTNGITITVTTPSPNYVNNAGISYGFISMMYFDKNDHLIINNKNEIYKFNTESQTLIAKMTIPVTDTNKFSCMYDSSNYHYIINSTHATAPGLYRYPDFNANITYTDEVGFLRGSYNTSKLMQDICGVMVSADGMTGAT